MIYFIQDSATCNIKIGRTGPFSVGDGVDARIKSLQIGNPSPLVLLAVVDGGFEEEAHLHQLFASHRLAGEWFRPSPALLQHLFEVARSSGWSDGYNLGRSDSRRWDLPAAIIDPDFAAEVTVQA